MELTTRSSYIDRGHSSQQRYLTTIHTARVASSARPLPPDADARTSVCCALRIGEGAAPPGTASMNVHASFAPNCLSS
jgi:hypothetical protein